MSGVVEAHAEDVLRYLVRRVADPQDAADLLGETLLVVWRRARDLPADDEQARMWMFGIARRTLLAHGRGRRRRQVITDRLREQLRDAEPDVADIVNRRADVRTALGSLPGPQREVVVLVHGEGMTLAEAAQVMGVSASTTRGRYAAALAALRVAHGDGASSLPR
ncbi:RNA polymerase sigma factor [Aeromicrobium massiliense]|uniref:RNA polymerase sigma factor n=1 Tax=Aeromicrobium massiliense TaxID=1464554 RepID=UPI001C54E1A4|nr:sigma-70 family RNA polymerase sigma factor [Aeromicrobium massiliense]